jgi:SAM-dependent methyltransferase
VSTTLSVKTVLPKPLRSSLRRIAGIDDLHARIDELEQRLAESREETWARSRSRWREASPTTNLTWDEELTGEAFIAKVSENGGFGPDADVLEIGPGYGRLLREVLRSRASFRSYLGVDLSAENVAYLSESFAGDAISFVNADIETVELNREVSVVISSLTIKHIYPSFERAMENVARFVRPGGRFIFDLIEGDRLYWEHDRQTYIRHYTRDEVREILGRIGLTDISFDEVEHSPGRTRLLVLATRP